MNAKLVLFPRDKSVASDVDGEESVVGCDNRHYVDQTTLNVARGGGLEGGDNQSQLVLGFGIFHVVQRIL